MTNECDLGCGMPIHKVNSLVIYYVSPWEWGVSAKVNAGHSSIHVSLYVKITIYSEISKYVNTYKHYLHYSSLLHYKWYHFLVVNGMCGCQSDRSLVSVNTADILLFTPKHYCCSFRCTELLTRDTNLLFALFRE